MITVSKSDRGFRGTEKFCLQSPLSGTAIYAVRADKLRLSLDVHGFPPHKSVGLDWINNRVRGYMIGAFTSGATGSYSGTARVFRLGEVRAIAMKFERPNGTELPGTGKPC